jgi:hypothetical protein
MQRHFVKELAEDLERFDSDEVTCSIAAWLNVDRLDNEYLTVELSPKLRKPERHAGNIWKFLRDEE